MTKSPRRYTTSLALILLLAVCAAAYLPGLHGPYLMDDDFNLVQNPQLVIHHLNWQTLWDAAMSRETGPLHRPLAMASFALNYYYAGSQDTFPLKLTNVILHLVTALGIFLLTVRLLPRMTPAHTATPVYTWGALFVTALWALHPLHVSTVLYAVQRMAELSALFCVFGALAYVYGREALLAGRRSGVAWIAGAVIIGGALATFSKENGALLPILLLVIEAVCFRFRTHATVSRRLKFAAFTAWRSTQRSCPTGRSPGSSGCSRNAGWCSSIYG
jgi:hypothetical protein